jgi:hypothetical protein
MYIYIFEHSIKYQRFLHSNLFQSRFHYIVGTVYYLKYVNIFFNTFLLNNNFVQ